MRTITIIVLALVLGACAMTTQQNGIRDARIGLAAAGIATDAADKGAKEYFKQFPSGDTEKYCQGEIVTLILEEAVSLENLGADGVKLWETSLAIAMAKKDAGADYKVDWQTVLSSESDWMRIATDLVAVLDYAMREIEHAGLKVPDLVKYAYKWLYSLTGKPERAEYTFDWGDLKTGVCKDFLPGGAS